MAVAELFRIFYLNIFLIITQIRRIYAIDKIGFMVYYYIRGLIKCFRMI